MAGILASLVAGGVKGGFGVMEKQAGEKIASKREDEKQAVLEVRQKNLMLLSQKFQTGERLSGQEFKAKEGLLSRQQSGEQFGIEQQRLTTTAQNKLISEEEQAGLERESREKIAGMKKVGKEEKLTSAQVQAFEKIQEMIANGESIESINRLAKLAKLGRWEERPTGEKVQIEGTGFFGFGQEEEPEMEIVPAGEGVIPKGKTLADYKKAFDALSNGTTPTTADSGATPTPYTETAGQEGILSSVEEGVVAAEATKINPKLPQDLEQWDIATTQMGGRIVHIETSTGIKLTDEEFEAWRQWDKQQAVPADVYRKPESYKPGMEPVRP